ncbi:M23 family metallopeptidase [Patescibacteria group bacterium]|nr:M23 family metallopeptidase [Patescibacteria group bacterium]
MFMLSKRRRVSIKGPIKNFLAEVSGFSKFFAQYIHKKIFGFSVVFEKNKNACVKLFIIKRGRYNRMFLHFATISVVGIGLIVAPLLASTYPVFSASSSTSAKITESNTEQSISVDANVFQTDISQKPRDKTIEYTVQRGDTVSTIARKFGISEDTIRWANDMTGDDITVGDTLKILSVTGIAHKVASGETVYSIAKVYDANPQQIVDFPFNEFANPETFSLVVGQILIVPDGVKPSEKPRVKQDVGRQYYAGPVPVSPGGFAWPLGGGISQYASWYHMALDITAPVGTPVVAAENGRVTSVSVGSWDGGYGTNLWIDNGSGIATHYNHLSGVNVSVGQSVVVGKTVVGWVGMTGRTTGPHLHFEVSRNGALINPMAILQ